MSERARVGLIGLTIVLLVALLFPAYKTMVLKSREGALATNLGTMRDVIKQYTSDKRKAPQSLQDLVDAGYFRQLPVDPITDSNSTWEPVFGTTILSPEMTERGITGVHSGSSLVSSKGTTYRTW